MKRKRTNCQSARENGKQILMVRFPIELAERMANYGKQNGMPRTQVVLKAAHEYMERQQA